MLVKPVWVVMFARPVWAIGSADLFELSSPPDPYVSLGDPGPSGLSDPPDPSESSGLLDPFVLSSWSDPSGVSGLANPAYHGCRVCWVRLGLSPKCEVE
ncbi:hypothetical protein DEO72_LG7g1785 [Vigna unguiculata]|uniref:Secreted protein n=1 Tax=Vigna unguiculata TaxID=3917 RepID=A0A4D6ML46_VIGUN|nr:hypothetical protein DEO72_LG7g1785 [Vigna unguiculata]